MQPKLMRVIFTSLILVLAINVQAQQNPTFALARSLMKNQQFQASNDVLSDYIAQFPHRLYDQSTAFFLQSYNYMQLGAYYQAMAANKESMSLKERLGAEGVGENYMRSGAIYLLAGDQDRALDFLLNAKNFPIESGEVYALIDGYLGATYMELNDLELAEQYFKQSIESLEIDFGDRHPDLATGYYNLGRLYLKKKDYDTAQTYLKKALSAAVAMREHRTMGQVYNTLAKVYEVTQPDEAYVTYNKAISLLNRQFGKHHAELARTYLNLSRYYLLEEEEAKAREQLGNALVSLLPKSTVRDWQYIPKADDFTLDPLLLIQVLGQRTHLLATGVTTESKDALLKIALESTEVATTLLAAHLATLGGEASRLVLTEKLYALFEPGIKVALKLAESTEDERYIDKAFVLAERGKAMITKAMARPSDLLQTKATLELGLREALKSAQSNFEAQPNESEAISQLQEARRNLRSYQSELPKSSHLSPVEELVVEEVQKQIGSDEAVISYFLGAKDYYIFAVTDKGIKGMELPNAYTHSWSKKPIKKLFNPPALEPNTGVGVYSKLDPKLRLPDLASSVEAYRRALKKMEGTTYVFHASDLYGKLIFPIGRFINQKKRLLIVPHEELFSIPFEAFLTNRPKEGKIKYRKYDYLIEQFSVRYATALTEAFSTEKSTTPYEYDFLGIAPNFLEEDKSLVVVNDSEDEFREKGQQAGDHSAYTKRKRKFNDLPFAEEEVTRVADLFSKEGQEAKVLVKQAASEEAFKTAVGSARVLHLATHSFTDTDQLTDAGIAFAQNQNEESSNKEDGILYLPEIKKLAISAELVVLSSCEGNAGPVIKGEGVASLARAFSVAGSPNTLGALWPVYDRYTNTLMQAFYAAQLKGQSYEKALQTAKLQLLKDKKTAPRMWSGFVLYGIGK